MHGDLISVENYENKNVTLLFGFIDLLTFKTWTFFAEEKSHNSVYVHNNKLQVWRNFRHISCKILKQKVVWFQNRVRKRWQRKTFNKNSTEKPYRWHTWARSEMYSMEIVDDRKLKWLNWKPNGNWKRKLKTQRQKMY